MRERFREANERFAAGFEHGHLEARPAGGVVVLTCMDARIVPDRVLGLAIGDAHVLRNAGGRVTEDVIRSLLVSTWTLGTREVVVIHHTGCGLGAASDREIAETVRRGGGHDASGTAFLTFTDLDASVREDVDELRAAPGMPGDLRVSGHVYDVRTGLLREVVPAG